jgi:hypothetical protein
MFSRGDKVQPRNVLLLARITIDGAFANVTPDDFQHVVDGMQEGAMTAIGNSAFTMRGGVSCAQDSMAGKPLAVCRGSGAVGQTPYDLRVLFWIASGDDAIVLFYLDHDDAGAATELAKSIKLD